MVESLVMPAYLQGDVLVNEEIALLLSIFNTMVYSELINNEAFPDSANMVLLAKGVKQIGIVKVNFVGFLQTRHRFGVGIQKMKQFGALQAAEIALLAISTPQNCVSS